MMKQPTHEMMERIGSSFMTWFITAFVLLTGVIWFVLFYPLVQTWFYEPVAGIVVQSEMEYCGMEVGGYSEEVRFAYSVEGRRFRDGLLRPNVAQMCESKETIAAILEKYPVGAKVQAWYDPDRPVVAVIERSLGAAQWTFISVFCGFLFMFFCIWAMHRSNARRAALLERRRKAKIASAKE